MRKIILLSVFTAHLLSVTTMGQTRNNENSIMEKSLNVVQSKQTEFNEKLQLISTTSAKNKRDIQGLEQRNEVLIKNIDSLKIICKNLEKALAVDRSAINGKIQDTNNTVASNQSTVESRTLWSGIIAAVILLALLTISHYLVKRIKQGTSSINEVQRVQDALLTAQTKMQEESIKLDNKMIELFERQMTFTSMAATSTQIDHSLVLKVADEIVRIEINLSRMDNSVKGYKQLSKAVQRIKDNFFANEYEIVDLLGKQYDSGMKVIANFVSDETLEAGQQIITGIVKPQINYQGKMIQAAQITVSQNI